MTRCHLMTPLTRSTLTRARVWLIDTNDMSQPVILSPASREIGANRIADQAGEAGRTAPEPSPPTPHRDVGPRHHQPADHHAKVQKRHTGKHHVRKGRQSGDMRKGWFQVLSARGRRSKIPRASRSSPTDQGRSGEHQTNRGNCWRPAGAQPDYRLCNTRATWRFSAFMTPIRANIVGPPCVATKMRASIAGCHSAVS